jgi:hypothetical protein
VRRSTRSAVARLVFLVSERGLHGQACACRRPISSLVTPAIRSALDAVEEALAQEPDPGIGAYLEID